MEWFIDFCRNIHLIGVGYWLCLYNEDPTMFDNPKWYHHLIAVVMLVAWPITIPLAFIYDRWERWYDKS